MTGLAAPLKPVAWDADGSISKAYNLNTMNLNRKVTDTRGSEVTHALTERTTFVITPDYKVIGTQPADHVDKSLAIVRALKK